MITSSAFAQQAGPAGYYRWLVATRYLRMPTHFGGAVLDIGANNGAFLDQIEASLKVGLDLQEHPALAFAWVQADARHVPFFDRSFEHVIAFDVIEHVENDVQVLREVARVLKPGGTLWLSVPSATSYLFPGGRLQRRLERAWGHVRRGYTMPELECKLPASLTGEFLSWNEPAFRLFYMPLKSLHQLEPLLALRLAEKAYAWDSKHIKGEQGHWLACLQKTNLSEEW
jgi:SAM-dependent methyltransferase